MIITYEIEKTITRKIVSLKTLVEQAHTDITKYIDADRNDVLNDFKSLAKSYRDLGWIVTEYDVDGCVPSFVAEISTDVSHKKVELYMRSAMYYENDY